MKSIFRESTSADEYIAGEVRTHGTPLHEDGDLDPLLERIGDARYVLLGEASHGTHEYYTWRTRITRRLVLEKGFNFIGVEGDWPDCYRLNRYVKGYPGSGESAFRVLHQFNRWPTWMWANWEIVALAEWLRTHNHAVSMPSKVGFYGLDVYSLGESLEAILQYLRKTDVEAYESARKAAACFEPYGYEGGEYARAALIPDTCEDEVVDLLSGIRRNIARYNTDHETVFSTEQNALVAVHAEQYYRQMVRGGAVTWNIRDRHMVETLDRLMDFHGPDAKAVIWEHNTHIGDARATDMKDDGMVNVGELVSRRHDKAGVVRVGFGSYRGDVIAGRGWGDTMRRMPVPEAMEGSWEYDLHLAGEASLLLLLDRWKDNPVFETPIGHRAIGVVYHPDLERHGNYVPSVLPRRYEAFIHLDETRALHPLHIHPDGGQMPETYPWGV